LKELSLEVQSKHKNGKRGDLVNNLNRVIIVLILICGNGIAQNHLNNTLWLDGDSAWVEVPNHSSLNNFQQMTIEAWINPTLFDGAVRRGIISKINDADNGYSYMIRVDSYEGHDRHIEVFYYIAGDRSRFFISDAVVKQNEWAHIALVYNGATLQLFINGIADASVPATGTILNSNTDLLIGTQRAYYEDGTLDFAGGMDEVRIWNKARTESQINATLNKVLVSEYYATADSGLVGYWQFENLEDLGINSDGVDDVRDLSINSNNGDLAGNATLADSSGVVGIEESIHNSPKTFTFTTFTLNQNYPNPFNPTTTIEYQIKTKSNISLIIYDLIGRVIETLVYKQQSVGQYSVTFDASGLASGIYIYKLNAGGFEQSKKMLLLR